MFCVNPVAVVDTQGLQCTTDSTDTTGEDELGVILTLFGHTGDVPEPESNAKCLYYHST